MLHAPCALLQACKTCTPHSCWQMGLRRTHGLRGTAKMAAACPCSLQRPFDCTKGGHLGRNSKDPCVLGTCAQMGREFYRLLRNAHSIFTHIFLALMVKLNIASKKSCSKCFLILFLFNKWEMFPNSGLKNSIFLKKQVVEESLWLLAATVHAQLKNMPAWQRASNQAPGRTHSFPEVTKYSKNL